MCTLVWKHRLPRLLLLRSHASWGCPGAESSTAQKHRLWIDRKSTSNTRFKTWGIIDAFLRPSFGVDHFSSTRDHRESINRMFNLNRESFNRISKKNRPSLAGRQSQLYQEHPIVRNPSSAFLTATGQN